MRAYAALAAALALACHTARSPAAESAAAPAVALDTVRGIVMVVGSEPMTAVVLSRVNGDSVVAVEGSPATTLRRLSGLEVMVVGLRTTKRSYQAGPSGPPVFDADSFVVRAADRVAAHDGIVSAEGGKYFLVTSWGGRLAADHLPAALRAKPGARVFLVGPLDRAPASYGVIAERP